MMVSEKERKVFSAEEVAAHHETHSLWVVISDKVYDLTQFMEGQYFYS